MKDDSKTWDNRLSVAPELVTLKLKDGKTIQIPPKSVTGLSYGQEAYRRLTAMLAVFGLFHKSREHLIGIEYAEGQKREGLLLQGDKDDYLAILSALETVTAKRVSAADKDRKFIAGLDKEPASQEARSAIRPNTGGETLLKPSKSGGSLSISAEPNGAAVYVDSNYACSSPCTIPVNEGRHRVTLVSQGFFDWSKELKVSSGEEVTVKAALQRAPAQ